MFSVRAALLIGASLACGAARAAEDSAYFGKWNDLASGLKRIGAVDIQKNKIIVGKSASYGVSNPEIFPSKSEEFSDGEIFKVTSVDKGKDPFGCGEAGKVRYIVLLPFSDDSTSLKSFELFFYGGAGDAPPPETLKSDLGVCDSHSFGKFLK